jgi:hypothetical protein
LLGLLYYFNTNIAIDHQSAIKGTKSAMHVQTMTPVIALAFMGRPFLNLSMRYFHYHAIIVSNSSRDQEREENMHVGDRVMQYYVETRICDDDSELIGRQI